MSDFRIKTCVLGGVSTNCYIAYNDRTKEAVILDPADNAPYIQKKCGELGVKPSAVLLTHGHFDHILGVPELCRAIPGLAVYAAGKEAALLADPQQNLAQAFGAPPVSLKADREVRDGDRLSLLGLSWQVIETPGHTKGSVCYYLPEEAVLFAGDTLFYESYGRTDFPGGSGRELIDSITRRLFALPDDTMVYPGHGDPTTIRHEKEYNPISYYQR